MKFTNAVLSTAVLFTVAASAFGQDRRPLAPDEQSQYVVSAKAGAVSIVEGDAFFKRGKGDWDLLIAGDELRTGDAVRTGVDGRVEILLNPGSFLRLSENSEFIFTSTSIYNLKLKVVKGSAIVEASTVDSEIGVTAGESQFSIIARGLYRFSVDAYGRAEALVRKGKVLYAGKVVKDGKKIAVSGGAPVITAFDKKAQDSFDAWSRTRAQTIIAANQKLSKGAIRQSLSFGWVGNLWLYDSLCRCYTFLPFGTGFNSPYGFGYRTCNPYYDPWRYNNYPRNGTVGGNGGGSTGSSGGSGSGGGTGSSTPSYPIGGNGGGDRAAPPPSRGADTTTRGRRID